MRKLKVLDLFSGIGGFSLGLERTGGFETVAFCEIDPFCQKVLKKHWPEVEVHSDVTNLKYRQNVDLVTAGFPCQDISQSGECAGLEGGRSGLFWYVLRTLCMVGRPRVLLENVAALLYRGLSEVLGALATFGYDTEWHCIQAADVGAPHIRDRLWIIADPQLQHMQPEKKRYLDGNVFQKTKRRKGASLFGGCDSWPAYTGPIVLDDGVHRDVGAHIAYGNSIVPQIPEIIGHAILEAERQHAQ